MSPTPPALEIFAEEEMAGKNAVSFEIGTDTDSEKEKGDIERFQTPEPGKKRLTAAKAAAAALEKDNKDSKSVARSSGDAGFRVGDRSEELVNRCKGPESRKPSIS